MKRDIYGELCLVFRDVFDDDKITIGPSTTSSDIADWDSKNHILLTLTTEDRFGIRFRTAELEMLRNVGDFARLIEEKLGLQGGK